MRSGLAIACHLGAYILAPAQWESLQGGVNRFVRTFLHDATSDRLLVGGSFPYAQGGSLRVNNLAWWDGAGWDTTGLADGNGSQLEYGNTNPVLSLAMRGDTLFLGHLGDYWHDRTELAYATMLINGVWQPCAEPNGLFYFLEANGRMFSGGVHDTLYHEYAPGIHEWRNGAFRDIPGMPFTSEVQVNDVAYWHGQYYFGGIFNAFGSLRMVAFDGVDQWSGLGQGVGGYFVRKICGYGDSLYVGGFLQDGPNVQSQHIQLWDGNTWKPFFPQVRYEGAVYDIQVHDGALYVSGYHRWPGDPTAYGLLRYDGHSLCSIGGPVGGDVGKMAFFQGDLYHANQYIPGLEDEYIGRLPLEGLVPDRCAEVGPNSIREIASEACAITVFPNPASKQLGLQLPAGVHLEHVEVRDAVGKQVLALSPTPTEQAMIDVEELRSGSYSVHGMARGVRYHGRFVKE